MEDKNYVGIRLTPSSKMTLEGAVAHMCHDIRTTRPGYLRDDEEAKCYWYLGNDEGRWNMEHIPPKRKAVEGYLLKRRREMITRYESTPRGTNGHLQRAKVDMRYFMEGIVFFSKEQVEKNSVFDMLQYSLKFLTALAERLKTKVAWAAIHDDETTLHLQFGLENLDSEAHTIQRRINKRVDQPERNHLMTTTELQDIVGEHFAPLGFIRGVSRDVTGRNHKSVRDVFRLEQASMKEKKMELTGDLLDLYFSKDKTGSKLKRDNKKYSSLLKVKEEEKLKAKELREKNELLEKEINEKKETWDVEREIIEKEVVKIAELKTSEKKLRQAAIDEFEKRENVSEEIILGKAKEHNIEDLYLFLKKISEHAEGSFTLQKEQKRYYSGKEIWSTPEIISASDFVGRYPGLKEGNMLGDQFHIRVIGTPPIFCLDDVDLESIKKMWEYGLPPFASIETSPGNYHAWVRLCDEGILPPTKWHAINSFLVRKFEADSGADSKNHAFRCPGFYSYKNDNKGYMVGLHTGLTDKTSVVKSAEEVIKDIPQEIINSSEKKERDRGGVASDYTPEVSETPQWFIEKWQEHRADLIKSNRCPKRTNGTPDDSKVDYVVTLNLLSFYRDNRFEVLKERLGFCYNMLVQEADDPKRLHRKKDPRTYASRTLKAVTIKLGIEHIIAEEIPMSIAR